MVHGVGYFAVSGRAKTMLPLRNQEPSRSHAMHVAGSLPLATLTLTCASKQPQNMYAKPVQESKYQNKRHSLKAHKTIPFAETWSLH